jgi:putative DNA primase/helicase
MSRLERIVAACGGVIMDGGKRALIPGPDHSAKDRSVSLLETEEGRILIHCFSPKDDWRAVRRALADRGLLDAAAYSAEPDHAPRAVVVQPQDEERLARARRIWADARSLRFTPASAYLRRRGIRDPCAFGPVLRFHPRLTSLDDRLRRPALVAAILDVDGAVQGVQVTLLTRHGAAKAAVPTPRRIIGKLMYGAVRLGDVAHVLAIGEGVETMASASVALKLPAWAALTADNLALFDPPPCVDRLVIAADNDPAGLAAAEALRARLAIEVEIALPPDGAADWNEWAN